MSNKVRDLCTICAIGVHCHPRSNPKIVKVMWHLPCFGSVKINTDGAHISESSKAGSGGVFHDYQGHVLGAFSANLDVPSAVHAEVLAVIKAIELAWLHAWHNVWIETDSLLVTKFFSSLHLVPWLLRVDWQNWLHRLQHMSYKISHIFHEGNHAANALANHGALGSGLICKPCRRSISILHRSICGRQVGKCNRPTSPHQPSHMVPSDQSAHPADSDR
ncbi:hypothetical protein L3X38_011487 [Prunus dulcis]|uniref:RNase H type-1 domain-containing protein n=1 Tax=Prunus dulcis TaxID=3755 RepID=A0AAD4ZFG5_PRUDU|nr:hypothetical protein L3X38_011487 [Prunus dulcis]